MNKIWAWLKVILTGVCIVCICMVGVIGLSTDDYAQAASQSDSDTILKKVYLGALSDCYSKHMVDTVKVGSFTGTNSRGSGKLFKNVATIGSPNQLLLPNQVGNTISDANLSCYELFNGYSAGKQSAKSIFTLFGKSADAYNNDLKIALLENLGYNIETVSTSASTNESCFSVVYQVPSGGQYGSDQSTNQLCVPVSDGIIELDSSNSNVRGSDSSQSVYLFYDSMNGKVDLYDTNSEFYIYGSSICDVTLTGATAKKQTWDDFISNFSSRCVGEFPGLRVKAISTEQKGGESYLDAKKSSDAALTALRFFSGEKNATENTYSFVSEDKYFLYTNYLNQEFQKNHEMALGSSDECRDSLDDVRNLTGYAVRNGAKWCPIYNVSTTSKYNIVSANGRTLETKPFSEVIKALMNDINYERLEASGVEIGELEGGHITINGPSSPNPDDPGPNNTSDLAACYQNADVLGWIACPVLGTLGGITQGLYGVVENQLSVNAAMFTSSEQEGGLRNGWSQIRNFANILFAIAFLIVILAQVTGIGISNYNIKKILPRLIMVVILVNLSFIICQLAVDVSNILGSGLKSMFEDMAGKIELKGDLTDAGAGVLAGATNLLLGVGAVTTVAAVGFFVSWETWLFPMLIAFVGVVVSVFFFFLIIAVRQAGIIVLIILAPVAIVCYALPNTQSLYKRWQNMFVSLLLVYPICGALMGGGEFAARVILSGIQAGEGGGQYNGFLLITAMLVQVIPFFTIPSIVRSSMTAMGNLGNKLTGLEQRFGRWGQTQIGNTGRARAGREARQNLLNDRYQRASERVAARNLRRMQNSRQRAISKGKRDAWDARHGDRYGRAILRQDAIAQNRAQLGIARERGAAVDNEDRIENLTSSMRDSAISSDALAYEHGYEDNMNTGSIEELSREHDRLVNQVIDDPTSLEAQARLRAIQNIMLRNHRDNGADRIYQNYAHAQATRSLTQLESGGLRQAAGYLMRDHAAELKTYGGKGTVGMFQDMQGGNFSHRGSFTNLATGSDADAIGRRQYSSSRYASTDLSNIKAGHFNDLSNDWFKRAINTAQAGQLSADSAANLKDAITRYRNDPTLTKDASNETLANIDALSNALYGSNMGITPNMNGNYAVSRAGGSDTRGTQIIAQSTPQELAAIANNLQSAGAYDVNATGNALVAQEDRARTVANLQYVLDHSTNLSSAQVTEIQRALNIAQQQHYNAATGSGYRIELTGPNGSIRINQPTGATFNPRTEAERISNISMD